MTADMPDDNASEAAILDLVRSLREIEERAMQHYQPVVEGILRTGSRAVQHIERTLDGLLDFCGHAPALLMYRKLCRHYWRIDQAATAHCINAYREQWDSDEPGNPASRAGAS